MALGLLTEQVIGRDHPDPAHTSGQEAPDPAFLPLLQVSRLLGPVVPGFRRGPWEPPLHCPHSKQVLQEPEFSLALVSVVLAFLVGLVQFLASEALQVGSIPAGGEGCPRGARHA